MAAKTMPAPITPQASLSGQRLSVTVPQGAFDRRPSDKSPRPTPLNEERYPEVDPVKVTAIMMDPEEVERARAHDMTLVQLLIALSNFSKEDVKEVAARRCVIGAGTFNATPAFRLLRAIRTVIAERRRQFVHYRLQAMVTQKINPPEVQGGLKSFHLPESMSSPRAVNSLAERDAWWRDATSHSDIVRKENWGKTAAVQGRRHAMQQGSHAADLLTSIRFSAVEDNSYAYPSADQPRSLREKRDTFIKRQTMAVNDTRSVAEAARNAATLTRRASPQRGTRAAKQGGLAKFSDGVEATAVRAHSALDGGSSTQSTGSSSQKTLQFSSDVAFDKTTAGGYNSKHRVSNITREGLSESHVYLVQEECGEPGEASPPTTPEVEDAEAEEEASVKQRRRDELATIIMDASGGVMGRASNCPMGATDLIRTREASTPASTPSDVESPREMSDMPYHRETIVALNLTDGIRPKSRHRAGEHRRRSSMPSRGLRRPSSAGAIHSSGAIAKQAVSFQPESKTGRRRPSSASALKRPVTAGSAEQSSGRTSSGLRGSQTLQPMPVIAAPKKESKPSRQDSAVSTRPPSSTSTRGLNSASSVGSRSGMRSTETNLRKFNDYATGIRFETARGLSGLRQEQPWVMSKTPMTLTAQREWGWNPQKSVLSRRPSSAVDTKELRRIKASQSSLSGRIGSLFDDSDNLLPPEIWGAEIEKKYLPVPTVSSKSQPSPVRQQKLNRRVDELLDSVGYNLSYVRAGMHLRSQVRVELDPNYTDVFGRCGNARQRQEATITRERPPKVTKVVRDFGERRKLVPHVTTGCRAATHTYLQEMQTRLRPPAIPKCLQIGEPVEDVDALDDELEDSPERDAHQLNISNANMCDDEAIPMFLGLKRHSASFNVFDLGGNPRLTDSTYLTLFRQLAELAGENGIRHLDLSGATGMGESALLVLSKCFNGLGPLGKLEFLRMDGIAVAEHVWPTLEGGMQSLLYLKELSLADMHIGRQSQRSAVSVADILLGLPSLQSLNVSSNYFGLLGCKTLAENMGRNRTLVRLDLSYNAGGFVSMATAGKAAGNAKGYEQDFPSMLDAAKNPCISQRTPAFNPISLICEGVAHARALKVLNLSSCQLTYDEDFVLEDAIPEKAGVPIEELDLAGNPTQGPMGARCLLRLTINTASLERLDVCEFREALPPEASIPYEPADPSVHYQADLSHPQHRALIRTLVRRCRNSNEDPRKSFEWEDRKLGETIITSLSTGNGVPDVGCIRFGCKMDKASSSSDIDIQGLIDKLGLKRKLRVSLWGFTRLAELFKNLIDEASRRVLLGAMASDLLLKLCHVRVLSEMDSKLRVEVAEYLLPAVHALDRMGGFDTMFNARGSEAPSLQGNHKSTLNLLMFNSFTPNGHYEMDLSVPADRRILEQLLIINEWERARAVANDCPDLSQHGRHECFRNVKINGSNIKFDSETASIPPRGEMIFDYCTPFHVPSDTDPSSNEVVELIEQALINSVCSAWLKVHALRTVLHRLVLNPQQFADMVKVVPAAQHMPGYEEGELNLSPRVEAFIMLYPFCIDVGAVVSSKPHGLYGLRLLARDEILIVRLRLGRLRTWNILRCEEVKLCAGPPLPQNFIARKEDAEKDENSMRRLLATLQLRDDPTSRGNANRYVLNLGDSFEDLVCMRVLLELSSKEPGEHFDMPSWSEKAHLEERGTKWLIPDDWRKEVPQQGILSVRYFSERDGCKDEEVRKALAVKYLGW